MLTLETVNHARKAFEVLCGAVLNARQFALERAAIERFLESVENLVRATDGNHDRATGISADTSRATPELCATASTLPPV
jgi:hypothetical protein